ncbi:50S ribosomal protein L19 [Hibiscus syriacus]|uniref:50S ribosomal protein L19 n=1 Tax=Hibiscus syriacus TaxID=106335 RepID=A0A6A2ZEC6_HIBSY|nr:50S ribosomal protein L19-1, chloroplastic-like [Hibiscus syriacus]KAE8690208.1 50S ribosomal protein L19 [Hibiscus syriacus]
MASQLFPQALHMIPINQVKSFNPVKNLGFSAFLSRGPSPLTASKVSVSGTHLKFHFGSDLGCFARRDFIVRAESNPEAEANENGVEEPETKAEAEVEAGEGGEDEVEEEKPKEPYKPRVKLGDIMGILNKRAIEASDKERPTPDLRAGDIVEIKLEVPENKRRLSVYKGIVISKQNAGIHTTIRIRRIIAGIGVEIVFPVYSPNIKEIKVVKHRKVRRARLYYLRDKLPRLSTFK